MATPFALPHAIDDAEKGEAISQSRGAGGGRVTVTVPVAVAVAVPQLLVTSKCTTCRYLWLWEQVAWQPPLKPQIGRQRQRQKEGERDRERELCCLLCLDISSVRGQQRIKLCPMHAVNCPHILHTHTLHTHILHPHTHTHKLHTHCWTAAAFRGHCTDCSLAAVIAAAIARAYATRQIAQLLQRTNTHTHTQRHTVCHQSLSPPSPSTIQTFRVSTQFVGNFCSICFDFQFDFLTRSLSLSLSRSFYYYARHSN